MASARPFFRAAGVLKADEPSYVERPADAELVERVLDADYCYVLATRQMGKSSLIARAAERLRAAGVRTVTVDITSLATAKKGATPADQWLYGFFNAIAERLGLDAGLDAWWSAKPDLLPAARILPFFRDIVLAGTEGPVVVFVDEIDSTLGLPFKDDLFAALRACYNARAHDPRFDRLTLVLLGTASPSHLISDPSRTPFNVATRIPLTDFALAGAGRLAVGFAGDPVSRESALARVLYWTDGHPNLTQKICHLAAEAAREGRPAADRSPGPEEVDRAVHDQFFAPGADRKEDNLNFVRNRLTARPELTGRLLRVYRRILSGRRVADQPTSPVFNELKLCGLVKDRDDGTLAVRNRIYARVFDRAWVRRTAPPDWARRTASAAVAALVLAVALYAEILYPRPYRDQLRGARDDYQTARDAYDRLRRVPFWGATADDLWGEFLSRRAADSGYREERDRALLWRLKAMTAAPGRPDFRRAAAQLVGEDYPALEATLRADVGPQPVPVVLSPDGRRAAYLGPAGVRVVEPGRAPAPSAYPLASVGIATAMAFSPDGRHVAATNGPELRLAEIQRPEVPAKVLRLPGAGKGAVGALAFSADGRRLAALCREGAPSSPVTTASIWDVDRTEAPPTNMAAGAGGSDILVFSPDGRWLATTIPEGYAVVWDTSHPTDRPVLKLGSDLYIRAVAFSPEGRRLVLGTESHLVIYDDWTKESPGGLPMYLRQWRSVYAVAYSLDGRFLAIGGHDGAIRVVPADRPRAAPIFLRGHDGPVAALAFGPRGDRLTSADGSGVVRVWGLTRAAPPAHALAVDGNGPSSGRDVLAVSPDGRLMAAAPEDDVFIWDLRARDHGAVKLEGFGGRAKTMAFSDDGRLLAVGSEGGAVTVWDFGPGGSPAPIPPAARLSKMGANVLLFGPGGRTLVGGDSGGKVTHWTVGAPPESFTEGRLGHDPITCLAFRDGHDVLAAGDRGGLVQVWDVPGGRFSGSASATDAGPVQSVALSPEGRWLAWATPDPKVRVKGLDSTESIRVATGRDPGRGIGAGDLTRWRMVDIPSLGRWALAFSRDGRLLLSATNGWAHAAELQGGALEPFASLVLPGAYPAGRVFQIIEGRAGAFQAIAPTGLRARAGVVLAPGVMRAVDVDFGGSNTTPLAGDPRELLESWGRRLGLKIDDRGDVVLRP